MHSRRPLSVTNTPSSRTGRDTGRLSRLRFHLRSGDYLPTLVTILGFVEETLASFEPKSTDALAHVEHDLIDDVRKDLLYVNEHYDIRPKAGVSE